MISENKEIDTLKEEVKKLKEQNSFLSKENQQLKEQKTSLTTQNQTLLEENERLHRDLQDLKLKSVVASSEDSSKPQPGDS